MTDTDGSYDLNLAAATLRANSSDVHSLVKALFDELRDTLGDRLLLQRGSGRVRKSDEITSLRATLGTDQFEAVVDGGSLRCTVGHFSGGIRIRSESIDVEGWLVRLLAALQAEAQHSDSARRALEKIVIGGSA